MPFSPTNVPHWRSFAVAYASALHASGASTAAVEAELTRVLSARGVEGSVMATPTALWIEVGDGAHVVRVEPQEPKLDLQAALHDVGSRVAEGLYSPQVAVRRIARLSRDPGPYPAWVSRLAFVVSSAASAVLLGGTATDAVAAGAVSAAVIEVSERMRTRPAWSRLADGAAAFTAATLAWLVAPLGASPPLVALAAVILLAPGLMMTTGAAETAAGHWSSGAARFAGAAAALVQLAAGLVLPPALLPALPVQLEAVALPAGTELTMALLLPLALGVLVRVRPIDLGWVVAVSGAAYAASLLDTGAPGALAGAFAGTVFANAIGRFNGSASGGLALPALLMLVPGSVGVKGVSLLLGKDVVPGLETAIGAAIAASALAAGMLLGHALVPEVRPTIAHPATLDVPVARGYPRIGPPETP
jgi:uncharacterized membrane protein YjjP (DUF1212 family)